jgi:hypothetical protein
LIVDKVENSVVGRLSFKLRSHVTSAMDCHEGETITNFNVASNLGSIHILDIVGAPGFLDFPIQLIDPLLSTIGCNSTISVTRVFKNLVFSLKKRIDPLRGIH